MSKSDITTGIATVAMAILFIIHNGYLMRWGTNYQKKQLKWYMAWRRVSFWLRAIPFPILWHNQTLSFALSYGILVWVFYDFAENWFLGKPWWSKPSAIGSIDSINLALTNEGLIFATKLTLFILLFLSILFHW